VFDERVFEYLLPADAFLLIDNQTFPDEVLGVLSDLSVVGELQGEGVDAVEVLLETSAGPGGEAEYHFVEHEAETPDVGLGGVGLVFEQLRGHVDGRAADIGEFLPAEDVGLAGEPEVCDFVLVGFDEYVGGFDVSVDVALADDDLEAVHDLVEDLHALRFCDFAFGEFCA
jgi:hypothetical protein